MLKFIMPLAVGALIGYCTNYIAVRMLFHPYYPVKVGRFTLPFTPGIIPKRKPALAKAIGNVVGTTLVGEKELQGILEDEDTKRTILGGMSEALEQSLADRSLKDILSNEDTEAYEEKRQKLSGHITEKMMVQVEAIDIDQIMMQQAKEAVSRMGGMVAMFANDKLILSIVDPISENIRSFLQIEGRQKIQDCVDHEIEELEEKQFSLEDTKRIGSKLEMRLSAFYDQFIQENSSKIIEQFKVSEMVETKINEMDIKELEKLILQVMKHELNAIVNLGALIGLLLGLINLLFL